MSWRAARSWLLVAAFLLPATAAAQQPVRPIQDNSFLLEEAYNQEAGVVQRISRSGVRLRCGWEARTAASG